VDNHGLSPTMLRTIHEVLKPYSAEIERVGLFGSRATGTYRDNSDIDLVLYGTFNEATLNRIVTLFKESTLPVTVDVVAYHLITHAPLREHIDRVVRTLF
jgi:predicted nucleotidyltransferase